MVPVPHDLCTEHLTGVHHTSAQEKSYQDHPLLTAFITAIKCHAATQLRWLDDLFPSRSDHLMNKKMSEDCASHCMDHHEFPKDLFLSLFVHYRSGTYTQKQSQNHSLHVSRFLVLLTHCVTLCLFSLLFVYTIVYVCTSFW